MPLFAGGALQAAQTQAEGNAEAATLAFEFQKQQHIYQTIVTYMQALQYEEQLEKNKQSVKAAEKRWLDTKALQNKGMALVSDVMNTHVYVLRRQLAVDETANAYQVSLEQLALLMGAKKSFSQAILSQPNIRLSDESLSDLLQYASERRLDFQAMQQRWQASSSQRDIAYAGNLPQVHLVASQEWNSATPALKHGNAMVGVTVSMNIFNGGSDHAKQRQAESSYAALQWQIADQKQLIANQVRQAWRALEIAERKLNREQQVFQQSKESLRILSLRYTQGLETTSEVLDAQVAMDDSQVAIVHARSDMMIAQAALLLSAGLLNEGVVL
jgi:outer membrane protein TolC